MISAEEESSEVFVQEVLDGLPRAPWYFKGLVTSKSTLQQIRDVFILQYLSKYKRLGVEKVW